MFEIVRNVVNTSFSSVNNSKFFAGIMMLLVNIGSRYVTLKFSKSQEEYIKSKIAREFLIFAIIWMATRDLFTSIVMTASFIILADYLFNENSQFCVLPEKFKNLQYLIDSNNDGIISDEEIKQAEETLRKAKLQKKKTNQLEMLSYLSSSSALSDVATYTTL